MQLVTPGVASGLVMVECLRTLDRLGLRGAIADDELATRREAGFRLTEEIESVEPTRPILSRASQPPPTPLGTLDAIHLATATFWRESPSPTCYSRLTTRLSQPPRAPAASGSSASNRDEVRKP